MASPLYRCLHPRAYREQLRKQASNSENLELLSSEDRIDGAVDLSTRNLANPVLMKSRKFTPLNMGEKGINIPFARIHVVKLTPQREAELAEMRRKSDEYHGRLRAEKEAKARLQPTNSEEEMEESAPRIYLPPLSPRNSKAPDN